ncbi:MAG: hypothetical protein ACC655_08120, partial [Rhodothermia bacterium]
KDLDDPADFAAFPYEANDNHVQLADCVAAGECGLSLAPDGANPALELMVTPPGPVYLKIPDDVSGENFQVEVTKVDPFTSLPIPERVITLSPVYTSWKRVMVERDRMFRKGGLLAKDFDPATCGAGGVEPECDQVIVFDWSNLAVGDEVVLFQTERPYGGPDAVPAQVTGVSPGGDPYANSKRVTLNVDLGEKGVYWHASSDQPGDIGATAAADFSVGQSAGLGMVSECDSAPNQLNADNSCFYEGDLRGTRSSFGDGFTAVRGHREGTSSVPFLGPSWVLSAALDDYVEFASLWFQFPGANRVQMIGASQDQEDDDVTLYGFSDNDVNFTYVFRGSCEARGRLLTKSSDEVHSFTRDTTVHELGHQWDLNCCDPIGHDTRDAWCIGETSCAGEGCVMHFGLTVFGWDDEIRFCIEDLTLGDPLCGSPPASCTSDETAIRTASDPI